MFMQEKTVDTRIAVSSVIATPEEVPAPDDKAAARSLLVRIRSEFPKARKAFLKRWIMAMPSL